MARYEYAQVTEAVVGTTWTTTTWLPGGSPPPVDGREGMVAVGRLAAEGWRVVAMSAAQSYGGASLPAGNAVNYASSVQWCLERPVE